MLRFAFGELLGLEVAAGDGFRASGLFPARLRCSQSAADLEIRWSRIATRRVAHGSSFSAAARALFSSLRPLSSWPLSSPSRLTTRSNPRGRPIGTPSTRGRFCVW